MPLGTAHIIQGNALNMPLPDASVDLICTSPPYFGLRSYQDGGQHYDGQIGSEATPAEFLDALLAATREMVRVLKPTGSIFVNLGDKYNSAAGGGGNLLQAGHSAGGSNPLRIRGRQPGGVPTKSLLGLPWRYAIRCIDTTAGVPVHIVREMVAAVYNGNLDPRACDEILSEYEAGGRNAGLGLILRAEIIWNKPNGLPESVTDRVRRSHEQWFHLVKQPRYFAAVDEIREEHETGDRKGLRSSYKPGQTSGNTHNGHEAKGDTGLPLNPLGKLPGSVWSVPTQPLTVPPELGVDHFAAYPMEFPRRIIQGWTPNGICTACGFLLGSSYDNGMLGVRKELRTPNPQRQTSESILLQGVLEQEHGTQSDLNQIQEADDSWLRGGLSADSPDGPEEWLSDGAQADHGQLLGAAVGAERSGSSPERNQNGQPDREPRATGESRARQAPETSPQTVRMPPLRRTHAKLREPQPCPNCGGTSFRNSVILDNFGGTGTTALVAKALGRTGITIDLSSDYCRLAEWRCNDPRELAAALQIEKPEPIPAAQPDLFG